MHAVPVVANDPFFGRGGLAMAATQREQTLKELRKKGEVTLWQVPRADHTFQGKKARDQMIRSLREHLERRYQRSAPTTARF